MKARWIVAPFAGFVLLTLLGAAPPGVTTAEGQAIRTYSVSDLLGSIPRGLLGDVRPGPFPKRTVEERLILHIVCGIEPRSWNDMGGQGTIEYEPRLGALVVGQMPGLQKVVEDWLSELRRCQESAVSVEVRFAVVGVEHFDRLGLSGDRPAVLDGAEVARLVAAVRADPGAAISEAPRALCFGRHLLTVDLCDRRTVVTGREYVPGRPRFLPAAYPCCPSCKTSWEPRTPAVTEDIQVYVRPAPSHGDARLGLALGVRVDRIDAAAMSCFGTLFDRMLDPAEKAAVLANYARRPHIGTFECQATLNIRHGETALLCGPACRGGAGGQGPPARLLVLVNTRLLTRGSGSRPTPGKRAWQSLWPCTGSVPWP
jgi:hypothetical protein